MEIDEYLAAIDAKLAELGEMIVSWTVQRELDAGLARGFIKGTITFVDSSRLEFSEQLPVQREKYRLQYMTGNNQLIARWDSAPHHQHVKTFPFHKHTPQGIEESSPITLLAVFDEILGLMQP